MGRRAIMLAGVAAMVSVAFGQALAGTTIEAEIARFSPPLTPLVLTRSVVRVLADGKEIVVTRRYAVQFIPEADGYRLEGHQISATVDAPPVLARMAEMERNRIDNDLFPARLDAQGMIRETSQAKPDSAFRAAAVNQGEAIIAAAPMPEGAKRERLAGLAQVGGSSVQSVWPQFLFNPGPQERVERRSVQLSDGKVGEVEVRFKATGLMPGGLPGRAERQVITRLAGTSRLNREIWTISPATP